jgi:hypothetical protein
MGVNYKYVDKICQLLHSRLSQLWTVVDLFGDDIKITNRHNFNPVVSNYRPLGGLFWYSCYGDNKLATALLLPESGCLCSNGGVCRVSCVSAIGVADGVFVVGLVSFNLMICRCRHHYRHRYHCHCQPHYYR